MFTNIEKRVLDYLAAQTDGGWWSARQIADHSGVFDRMSNRSKAGAMTALLKTLHHGGFVEKETSAKHAIWRIAKK